MALPRSRDRLGNRGRIAGDGEVEVDHVALQGRVADRTAGDPNTVPVGQRTLRQANQRRRGKPLRGGAHAGSLGTRAEIPQVTS